MESLVSKMGTLMNDMCVSVHVCDTVCLLRLCGSALAEIYTVQTLVLNVLGD